MTVAWFSQGGSVEMMKMVVINDFGRSSKRIH